MTYFRYPGNLRIGVRNAPVTGAAELITETVAPKQLLLVLLNGHQRFKLAGTEFLFSTIMPDAPGPKALLLRLGCESQLEYLENHGQPLIKIAISTDPDWLDEAGLDEAAEAAGSLPPLAMVPVLGGLSYRHWTLDQPVEALAREVVAAQCGGAGNLALMSRAIALYSAALAEVARLPGTRSRRPQEPAGDPVIARLAAYVASHLDDAELGPEELARGCGMGLRSLQRLCRHRLNCSPREFIRAQRMDAARIGLSQSGMNVAQAAHLAGYASTTSFSTAFKREFGTTPARAQKGPQKAQGITSA